MKLRNSYKTLFKNSNIKSLSLKSIPPVTFRKPLPLKSQSIDQRERLILFIEYQGLQIQSEIVYLPSFSKISETDIIAQFKEIQILRPKDIYTVLDYFNTNLIDACLQNAIEVNFLKASLNNATREIESFSCHHLNPVIDKNIKNNVIKLKINKTNFIQLAKKLSLISQEDYPKSIRLDANHLMDISSWKTFFAHLGASTRELIEFIEDPLEFNPLNYNENIKIFKDIFPGIPVALDENSSWVVQKKENIKVFDYLILKPSQTSLWQVLNLIDVYPTLKIVLSCMYEGPENLMIFPVINKILELQKITHGLEVLSHVKENSPYINFSQNKLELAW